MVTGRRNSTTQGVRKAVHLLQCFAESSSASLSVGDLSARTGWTKSSVSRLLAALHEGGLLKKDPLTGRYAPGLTLVSLAGAALAADAASAAVRPCLEALARESGETANLSVIDDGQLLTIDEVPSPQPIKLSGWLGVRHPLHGSSSGKVLLADLEAGARRAILNRGLSALTPHTLTRRKDLFADLRRVREVGYALNIEELASGLASVAAPVRNHSARVVAAISLAGPSYRFSKRQLDRHIVLIKAAGAEASRKLGFRSSAA